MRLTDNLLQTTSVSYYAEASNDANSPGQTTVVEDWGKYLGDNTMSTTILDRLMHRSALLAFEDKNYRLKEAAARLAVPAPT